MSSGRTHRAAGLLAGLAAAALYLHHFDWRLRAPELTALLFGVALSTGASLLPDVDTDSWGQRLFLAILIPLVAGLILLNGQSLGGLWGAGGLPGHKYAAYLGLAGLAIVSSRHRGWTHTLWVALFLGGAAGLLAWRETEDIYLTAFFVACVFGGYASHLVLDWKFF